MASRGPSVSATPLASGSSGASATALVLAVAGMEPSFIDLLAMLAQEHRRLMQQQHLNTYADPKRPEPVHRDPGMPKRISLFSQTFASGSDREPPLPGTGSPKRASVCTPRSSLKTDSSASKSNHSTNLILQNLGEYPSEPHSSSSPMYHLTDGDAVCFAENEAHLQEAAGRIRAGRGRSLVSLKIPVLRQSKNLREWYRHLPVVGPYGRIVSSWRSLTIIATIAAVIMAPFDIAFYWWVEPPAYGVAAVLLDVILLLDILFNFNVAIVEEGVVVTDRLVIAAKYLKTWFVLDFVSNFPVDWFTGTEGKSRKFVKFLKLPKMLRFIKLLRALKEFFQYVGMVLSFAAIALVMHLFTCVWAMVLLADCEDRGTCPPTGATYMEGLAMCAAVLLGDATAVDRIRGSELLGVLRGSHGLSSLEEFVAMVMTIVGLVLISCFFATTASAMKARNVLARTRARMLAKRRSEMRKAQIPPSLRWKVEETYEHFWERAKSEHDGILKDPVLSLDLRRNLALHIYGPALRKVALLRDLPDRCLKCLAQKVEVRTYTSGDMLMLYGECGTELFIIQQGKVQPVRGNGEPLKDCIMGEGCIIGELSLLHPGLRRTASIRCTEFSVALVLTVDAFVELRLTDLLEALRAQAAAQVKEYVEAMPHMPAAFDGVAEVEEGTSVEKVAPVTGSREAGRLAPEFTSTPAMTPMNLSQVSGEESQRPGSPLPGSAHGASAEDDKTHLTPRGFGLQVPPHSKTQPEDFESSCSC